MKRAYKKWRQEKEGKEGYLLLRTNFRDLYTKRKETAKLRKLEEEIKEARTEAQIWKIVNRERKTTRIVGKDIDRKILWEVMERRGIRKGIVERVKEIYMSTKNVVRVDGRVSERFWTEKGLRQGCPLSPILFSLLIVDIEEEIKKEQVGGVQVDRERIWSLAYADDLVIMARSEEGIKEMLKRMQKYLKKKKLYLNIEKSKMVCFRSGGGRRKRTD